MPHDATSTATPGGTTPGGTTPGGTAERPAATRLLLRRWPTWAAIALAGLVAYDLAVAGELAPILAASGLVYLGAAALRRPGTAWLVFLGTFVVLAITKSTPLDVDATWIFVGLAVPFVAYGLLRGAARPAYGLPLQTAAMAFFGAAAVVVLLVDATAAAFLVAAGLLGHAAWDAYHHRADRVVARSLAEFCLVLDTLLAVAIVVVAVRG